MLRDVLVTEQERQQIRALLASDARAAAVAQAAIAAPARAACARPVLIPPPHPSRHPQCFDPQTGAPLQFDRDRPNEHRSIAGAVLRGPDFDRGWANTIHNYNANDARNCALAAALLDDIDAGRRARDLLLGYADIYLDHVPNGRLSCTWGRLFAQALEEAVWSISMLWTTELLWKARLLGEEEVDRLRVRMFEPIVDLLWGEWYFIHNIRMWCNAAIGSIGLAFDDRLAKRHAITGDKGFRQQLIDGFRSDGLLFEGSPGYHDYAISAMLVLAEAMARNGYAPYRDEHLRTALLASSTLVQPDGTLPMLNDYGPSRGLATRNFATALRRYDDGEVRALAAAAFRQWRDQHFTADFTTADWNATTAYHARQQVDWFLAWDRLDEGLPHDPPRVADLRASGVAAIRPQPGSYLLLKCSRKGSGHDHHDKLSFIWWQNGRPWFTDMGTTSYALPLHEGWFKTSLAHHTVLVDGVKHERTDAGVSECGLDALAGTAQPYPTLMPDVRLSRRLHLRISGELVDEFHVRCDLPRTLDYVLMPRGRWIADAQLRLSPARLEGSDPSYKVLREAMRVDGPGALTLSWEQGPDRLSIDLDRLPPGSEVFLAQAPSDPRHLDRLGHLLVVRVTAREATFHARLRVTTHASIAGPHDSAAAAPAPLATAGR
jgi:hypothetical protein